MAEIELEFPITTNSSAKVREMADGRSTIVESTAGSALANTVCAEAGGVTKESANNPAINRNLVIFTHAVYPW
jgi:hypothetical protein